MKRLTAILSAMTLALAACGDTTSTEVTATVPEEQPPATRAERVALSDYLPGLTYGPDDEAWIEQDRQIQDYVATCMAEQGFEYVPFVYEDVGAGFEDWEAQEPERRAREGFGMAYWLLFDFEEQEEPPPEEEPADPNWAIYEGLSPSEREAYDYALWGEDPMSDMEEEFDWENATQEEMEAFDQEMERLWREREWKGCMDLGWEEVGGVDDEVWMSFDEQFAHMWEEIDARVQADPRFVQLQADWSACMTAAGFPFDDQEDLWMTLDEEFERIVTWPGEEDEGPGPPTTVAAPGIDLEPIEHEDGTVTFVDPEGNVYTEEEVEELWAELEEEWKPTFDRDELMAFFEREVAIAVAEWECSDGFWDAQQELWKEHQDRWANENQAALDAWKAEYESAN